MTAPLPPWSVDAAGLAWRGGWRDATAFGAAAAVQAALDRLGAPSGYPVKK